jgi:hypothetical protein
MLEAQSLAVQARQATMLFIKAVRGVVAVRTLHFIGGNLFWTSADLEEFFARAICVKPVRDVPLKYFWVELYLTDERQFHRFPHSWMKFWRKARQYLELNGLCTPWDELRILCARSLFSVILAEEVLRWRSLDESLQPLIITEASVPVDDILDILDPESTTTPDVSIPDIDIPVPSIELVSSETACYGEEESKPIVL